MLHKKLGEKIAETGYFAEFRPGTTVEGQSIIAHQERFVKRNFFVKLHKKSPFRQG
jgi:hypothetical protein